MKVFGIGCGRTGTKSLARAFDALGYKAVHCTDPGQVFFYDALTDVPIAARYRELDVMYPGSKFVLTVRDPDTWKRSWVAHRRRIQDTFMSFEFMWCRVKLYRTLEIDPEVAANAVADHNEAVKVYFAGRSDLLVMDITKGDGWPQLCAFLNKPVPDTVFPWENRS